MSLVVADASAALAWVLTSQATEASRRMLEASGDHDFLAPAIFQFEVFNVLVSLARRGSLSEGAYDDASHSLKALEVEIAPSITEAEILDMAAFARTVGLSLFDACYLQLAWSKAAV
jgi:predicted nucleic acid-binding protein